jgi:hypothetical protein
MIPSVVAGDPIIGCSAEKLQKRASARVTRQNVLDRWTAAGNWRAGISCMTPGARMPRELILVNGVAQQTWIRRPGP